MIEPIEFAKVMAVLEAGTGKVATEKQNEVYYDLLGDLPLSALQAAAKRALLAHNYPTIPPVGMLRAFAMELVDGLPASHGDAFDMVLTAVRRFGCYDEKAGMESLDPACRRGVRAMGGWQAVCESPIEDRATLRAQFRMAYDQIADRETTLRNLPESIRPAERLGGTAARIVEDVARAMKRID